MKKISSVISLILAGSIILSGCGGTSSGNGQDPKSVHTIVGSQDIIEGSIVTKGADYFKEEIGPDTEVKKFDAGRDINNALMSDSIDFGNFGVVPTVVGLTGGNDFKVIWIACLIRDSECLIAREGSGIESVADLKGRKVAVTTASSGHYGLICALEDAGLTVDDIELVDMDPPSTYAAWERGDIDATYTWNPTALKLTKNGGKMITSGAALAKIGHPTINFHVVRRKFAEEHPEQVKAYIRAVARGTQLYKDDESKALEIMASYLDMSEEDVKALMVDEYVPLADQLNDDAFGNDTAAKCMADVAAFLKDAGQITDAKDLDFFKSKIDLSYLEEVMKEGLN